METNSFGYQVSGGCRGDLTMFMSNRKRALWSMFVQEPTRKDLTFQVIGFKQHRPASSKVKHIGMRSQGNILSLEKVNTKVNCVYIDYLLCCLLCSKIYFELKNRK